MTNPKVISLTYVLRTGSINGEIIETAEKSSPAEFLFGTGNLIKEFEDQIQDLKPGETFEFTIESDNAYGPPNPSTIVSLPRSIFTIDGQEATDLLVVGKIVPMRNDQGNPLQGKVLEVEPGHVKMDFNHPLAGHDLHFKGEVLSTREASQSEIDHNHVHTGKDGH